MKYIMLKRVGKTLTEFAPIIFPNNAVHAEIAEVISNTEQYEDFKIHSAGEWDGLTASGFSATLGIGADEDDTNRILLCDYGGCFE
jgi:hypothetical protein